MKFRGIYTALITPFKNGKIDEEAFVKLVKNQVNAGVSGVVVCGTTGESPTLTHSEHNHVIDLCIKAVEGKIQVIAGTGSNSTQEAISITKHAENAGADAALVVTPYYNKPTQEGLYQHFKAIHDNTNIPIILYNIPGRCIVNIELELLVRLAKLPRIVGVKDATGDLSLPSQVIKRIGKEFVQLTGDDPTTLPFYSAGGHGCISVTSNIYPTEYVEMFEEFQQGNIKRAMEIQNQLVEINQALFCETNPTPIKFAAELKGICSGELRLPLVEASQSTKIKIKKVLEAL